MRGSCRASAVCLMSSWLTQGCGLLPPPSVTVGCPTTWLAWGKIKIQSAILWNAWRTFALSYSHKGLSWGQCVTCSNTTTWSRAPSHANSHSSWMILHPPHAAISFQTKSFEFVFIMVYLLLSFQRTLCKSMAIFSNKQTILAVDLDPLLSTKGLSRQPGFESQFCHLLAM